MNYHCALNKEENLSVHVAETEDLSMQDLFFLKHVFISEDGFGLKPRQLRLCTSDQWLWHKVRWIMLAT